jgi:protein ImuB
MKIPSYDDLAPSITDVHPRETFDFAARVVAYPEEPVVRGTMAPAVIGSAQLFACLRMRGPARPGALMGLARDFSPRVERYGDSCVVLDVAGLGRLLGDAHGIAAELARTAGDRGLKVQMAVVPTQTAARVLALVADDPRVVTSDPAAALASLPLHLLSVLDADPSPDTAARRTPHLQQGFGGQAHSASPGLSGGPTPHPASRTPVFDVLKRWGLRTIGELAALAPDEIAARFGATGVAMHRRALGLDPRPLIPDPGVPRFMQSMELEWPIEELEPLSFVLARLLEPLSLSLERADKGAAAIRLDLRLTDKTTHTRMLQLPASMRDARVLRTLLLLDLESHPPAAGIDVVTIEVDPAPGRIVQFSLLERAIPAPETIATLTARLGALVGEDRCGSPVLVDSHRPDAFEMKRFGPAPRPQFPTAPKLHGPSLRRFRPPVAIRVMIDCGRPAHVPIDRKGMPGGRVKQCAGPWRTSGAWWDASGQAWDRDEWDVEFADGSVCRIFHARDSGVWFIEGVLD